MPNEYKTCIDCGSEFEFTERDQEFCLKQGWTPFKRCKSCRVAKKARSENDQNRGNQNQNNQQDQYQPYNA